MEKDVSDLMLYFYNALLKPISMLNYWPTRNWILALCTDIVLYCQRLKHTLYKSCKFCIATT